MEMHFCSLNFFVQFMAGEEDFALYLKQVLKNLHERGACGALLWCWADYAESLYHLPPLVESVHERFFGIVRPDGSLKPHANVILEFANQKPLILDVASPIIDPKDYYPDVEKSSTEKIKIFYK